ncbi:ER lumen protein retaining receptor domain-containing protein [Rozella allomycis CSF55]|uniref:ER lumen protein retaining receptor domain-containing protein n=2 Tax=Rozella allomycis (strain CSF55) TaxID=988480 RepID=A0A075AS20_ROZAC|nr:ER lumen protein retaining receptor domain-containing protein [Rozella allomycis CSF55]|eukprot:EPZ33033.1 ER lumen protein retaining receptor domain-containing protein [Rozella allomycis CSF55]
MTVYATRYLHLFQFAKFDFLHVYNFFMKVFFLSAQGYVLYLMIVRFKSSLQRENDITKLEYFIVPCAILALLFKVPSSSFFAWTIEYLWAFSIFLESVAIFPQLHMLQKTGEAETITVHFLFCLGGYRFFYVLNWIYRWAYGNPVESVVILPGLIQTLLYSDFFYIYYEK